MPGFFVPARNARAMAARYRRRLSLTSAATLYRHRLSFAKHRAMPRLFPHIVAILHICAPASLVCQLIRRPRR